MRSKVLISQSTDPYINLAAEDSMFRALQEGEKILFLWRNRDAVIMGRYQNPYLECNLPEIRNEGVFLVRRQSGGGAVYHDMGNTNFTFMTSRDEYDKEENSRIVTSTLKDAFGIDAYRSGRNDILVEGKKISGSAFRLTSGKAFHHGTLLVNADLHRLYRYLKPERKDIEAKGIRSVPSEVANLSRYCPDIDHEKVCSALTDTLSREQGGKITVAGLDEQELCVLQGCSEKVEELKSWEWIFGKMPPFQASCTGTFPAGNVKINCRIKDGRFEEITVDSQILSRELQEKVCRVLKGRACSPGEILSAGREIDGADTIFTWFAGEF